MVYKQGKLLSEDSFESNGDFENTNRTTYSVDPSNMISNNEKLKSRINNFA